MLQLRVFNYQTGEMQTRTLAVENMAKGEWMIGRDSSCDLILESPEVSRVHGGIRRQQGEYYFTDFGSTNGSSINNRQAKVNQSYRLQAGDIIRIEEFVLMIELIQTQTSPAASAVVSDKQNGPQQWINGDLTVHCVQVIDETHDVKTFRLVADPPVLFTYKPGQFVTLELDINGERVRRPYSISSPPSRPHLLEITVKRTPPQADVPGAPPGLVSNWLHDHLTVGDAVKLIGGPMGNFTCSQDPAQKLMLISAGSGVTPMLSMVRWLYDRADERQLVFFHSARSPHDIIVRQELEFMASRQPNFRLALTVSRPEPDQTWFGLIGRLTPALLMDLAPDFKKRAVYVCGPDGFMQAVKNLFLDHDFPMENYFEESFGASAKLKTKPIAVAADQGDSSGLVNSSLSGSGNKVFARQAAFISANSFWHESGDRMGGSSGLMAPPPVSLQSAVLFAQSSQEIVCDPEASILEVAEQAGINNIRSGCRQGVCGTCKVRKLEGEVRYDVDPEILKQIEREAGYILACVACAEGRVVVAA